MAITFRGTPQSASEDGGAPQVTLTGVQAGDGLVAIGSTDFYTISGLNSPPTGAPGSPTWALKATGDDGTNGAHIRVWTTTAASTGTHTLTLPAPDDAGRFLSAAALIGADLTQLAAAGSNGTNSNAHVAPSVVAPTADGLLITGHACKGTQSTAGNYTTPSGMSLLATERDVAGSGYNSTLGTFDQTITASGATGTRTATYSASRPSWATIAIVIAAAAGDDHEGTGEAAGVTLTPGTGAGVPALAGAGTGAAVELTPAAGAGTPAAVGTGQAAGAILAAAPGSGTPSLTGTGTAAGTTVAAAAGVGAPAFTATGAAAAVTLTPAPGTGTPAAAGGGAAAGVLLAAGPGTGTSSETGPVDVTVLVGPTRLREFAEVDATRSRAPVTVAATRGGWTGGDTRSRAPAEVDASRGRDLADVAATRDGWTVDTTRDGWDIAPTREREE